LDEDFSCVLVFERAPIDEVDVAERAVELVKAAVRVEGLEEEVDEEEAEVRTIIPATGI
jgi:hypothetical protein